MPAWGLSKCCSTKVFTVGARNPPRLPSAPITAIPLAAAAPLNSRVGRVQNKGYTVINPEAARQNARITSGRLALRVEPTIPSAASASIQAA